MLRRLRRLLTSFLPAVAFTYTRDKAGRLHRTHPGTGKVENLTGNNWESGPAPDAAGDGDRSVYEERPL